MFDEVTERHNRVERFAAYLRLMYHRAHVEGYGSCVLFLHEPRQISPPCQASAGKSKLGGSQASPPLLESPWGLDSAGCVDLPCQPETAAGKRYLQFAFERDWFCLDIPRKALSQDGLAQVLARRWGFFSLHDRPEFELYDERVFGYDAIRKVYPYGDERSAAEDALYVLCNIWGLPLDFPLHVTATVFGDGPAFELDVPLG